MSAMKLNMGPFWLDPSELAFPPSELALDEPDGLLAVGGDLSLPRLLAAYRRGIFPWYSDGQPILWWTPNPRAVLFPQRLRVARSLRKTLRKHPFRVTLDTAFAEVLTGCAAPRAGEPGTWITAEMAHAYQTLHEAGHAHSVEAWSAEGDLAGGLYGVAIGGVFFGESMFTRVADASKVAFVHLVRQLQAWGFGLIDCQMYSEHLARFGAEEIPRPEFERLLERHCAHGPAPGHWQFELPPVED